MYWVCVKIAIKILNNTYAHIQAIIDRTRLSVRRTFFPIFHCADETWRDRQNRAVSSFFYMFFGNKIKWLLRTEVKHFTSFWWFFLCFRLTSDSRIVNTCFERLSFTHNKVTPRNTNVDTGSWEWKGNELARIGTGRIFGGLEFFFGYN